MNYTLAANHIHLRCAFDQLRDVAPFDPIDRQEYAVALGLVQKMLDACSLEMAQLQTMESQADADLAILLRVRELTARLPVRSSGKDILKELLELLPPDTQPTEEQEEEEEEHHY